MSTVNPSSDNISGCPKPIAQLVPIEEDKGVLFGRMKGTIRVVGDINLSFGFISLSIRDLSAILPSVFLKDSAFGYDFWDSVEE